jgi:hypothetical protein
MGDLICASSPQFCVALSPFPFFFTHHHSSLRRFRYRTTWLLPLLAVPGTAPFLLVRIPLLDTPGSVCRESLLMLKVLVADHLTFPPSARLCDFPHCD